MPTIEPDRIVVFAGPSLPGGRADAVLAAAYRPPARRGDFHRLIPERPRAIVLIDGEFHGAPAVWHREILDAIGEGIPVIGAASMGALRAAELHALGMIGCGRIFEAYRDGALDDDDEVALEYGPAELGFPPLSEPLVNIRATLEIAVREGLLDGACARSVVAYAKALHYPNRSFAAILDAPTLDGAARRRLASFLAASAFDQKRADALAALRLSRSLPAPVPPCAAPAPTRRRSDSLLRGLWAGVRASAEFGSEPQRLPPAGRILERAGLEPGAREAFWGELSWRWFARHWLDGMVATGRAPPCPASRGEPRAQPAPDRLLENRLSGAAWLALTAEVAAADHALASAAGSLADADREAWLECTLGGTAPPVPLAAFAPAAGRRGAALEACARRAVVVAWAAWRGVAIAPHELTARVRTWEAARVLPPSSLLQHLELAEGEYLAAAAERALAAWVVERGPAFFGFTSWSFEVALTRELQRLGLAEGLFARTEG